MLKNIPVVKLAMVAVSRDCFPITLSQGRSQAVHQLYKERYGEMILVSTIVQSEKDVTRALTEIKAQEADALIVYLGNFGPEGPETLLAQQFDGPVMFCAAAEETTADLRTKRGDAYCGLLNASYSLRLRNIKAYIPQIPVGNSGEIVEMIHHFVTIARILNGVRNLKIITFGPRPQDFLACNAPIKPLYDLGMVSIQENSELDLLNAYKAHESDARIHQVALEMAEELHQPEVNDILLRLAQYELTLLDWKADNMGAAKYVAFANKCWPAFAGNFAFVPCYVNGRLTARGIPVACEVDIYGALSEYMAGCASMKTPMLLDINNTVPEDMFKQHIKDKYRYTLHDVFMAFHCGNGSVGCLSNGIFRHHAILKDSIEPNSLPDKSRGTYEGNIKPGDITLFRLHSNASGKLCSYVAQGEVLPVDACSFGTIGVFAIPEMMRFYRNVLVEKHYPHHCAIAFGNNGQALYEAVRLLGVSEIDHNHVAGHLYPSENPFAL